MRPDADTFRTRQARADLDHLIRSAEPALPARVAALVPAARGADIVLDRLRAGHAPGPAALALAGDALALAAALPDDDFPAFVWSTAVLLRAVLDGSAGPGTLAECWDVFAESVRLAPPATRAALAGGFARAADLGRLAHGAPPTTDDRLTRTAPMVLPGLATLARRMPQPVRARIARSDGGSGAALRAALADPPSRLDTALRRSLDAALAQAGGDPDASGLAECAALCLLDACLTGDAHDAARRLWERSAGALGTLPAPARLPLMRGLRYLYESRDGWAPDTAATLPPG